METRTTSPINYFDFIKRRMYYLLIPFLSVFTITTIIAFALSPIYKSSTTILIEGQQIPSELVQSTVQTVVEEALEIITHRVMGRSKLLEIIERFDLYNDLRKKKTTGEIIGKMRKDIKVSTISAQVTGKRTGSETMATIAFSLAYEGKDPGKVQKVANTLASLYIEQNLEDREKRAKTTTDFIQSELKALSENINQLEGKIAEYKQKHLSALPEMVQFNHQMVQGLEGKLDNIEQQITNVRERKFYLEAHLAGIDPGGRTADAKQRLQYLYSEYTVLKASLDKKHPDVINTKRLIDALEQEVSLKDEIRLKQNQLEELRTDLVTKVSKFSQKHPDVIKLNKSMQVLENEIEEKINERGTRQTGTETPDNPAYISTGMQIETAEMDIEALKKQQEMLKARFDDYQKRLEITPQIESEYKLLTRDYDNARIRYQETLSKLMLARTAEGLEKSQKGQKFTIIDAAVLPEKPYKPNRFAIVFLGFVLSIGAGGGIAGLKEFLDQAIRSEAALGLLTRKPVLAVIPFIQTAADLKRKARKRIILGLSTVTGMGLCVLAVHMFYRPLNVLWFQVLRRLVRLGLISP